MIVHSCVLIGVTIKDLQVKIIVRMLTTKVANKGRTLCRPLSQECKNMYNKSKRS